MVIAKAWRLSVVMALAAIAIVAVKPNPVDAHDIYHICQDDTSYDWTYTGSQWNSTLRSGFQIGFDDWTTDIEKWQGGSSYISQSTNVGYNVTWASIGGRAEVSLCRYGSVDGTITFDLDQKALYENGTISMRGVTAHEVGHTLGLAHSGISHRMYAQGSGVPTMSTCVNNLTTHQYADLSHDDESALHSQHNVVSSYGAATANPSFEEGNQYWRRQNAGSLYVAYGGQDGSAMFGYYKGNGLTSGENAALFQDNEVGLMPFYVEGAYFKARVNHKKYSPIDSGRIKLTYKYVRRNYGPPNDDCENSAFPLGPFKVSWNDRVGVSGWYQYNRYVTPSTNWAYHDVPTSAVWVRSNHLGTESYDSVQGRVVVYNQMNTSTGYQQYIRLDRTRVMVKYVSN